MLVKEHSSGDVVDLLSARVDPTLMVVDMICGAIDGYLDIYRGVIRLDPMIVAIGEVTYDLLIEQ